MQKKILIVDDDEDIRVLLDYNLKKEGYKTILAENGKIAIDLAREKKPDLIILDVMMPEMDGIEVCEVLRADKKLDHVIICFLTARNEDYSQIAGLEVGADDYISKPIKIRILISRIKAHFRRLDSTEETLDLTINFEKHLVTKDNKVFQLPKKEFDLIALLVSNANNLLTREYILEQVWGTEVVVSDRTIDVHIRKLRGKFGDDCIQTIKGIGYKYVAKE